MNSKYNQYNDEELFKLFLDNNKSEIVFNEIINRFKQVIYWQIRKILISHDDTDEVCQIVFIKLWKYAESFKFNCSIKSYIYRIAHNESLTLLSKKNKLVSMEDVLDKDGHYTGLISSNHLLSGDEISMKLQKALLTLPEKQRMVFNYKYFDDLQYDEISEITGTSIGALKANYHHAVEKIKIYLENN